MMKNTRFFFILVCCLLALNIAGGVLAGDSDYEGWTLLEEGEVKFSVPPRWNYTRNPEQDILIALKPDNSAGNKFFLFVNRTPKPELVKVSDKDEKEYLQKFAIMMSRIISRQGTKSAIIKSEVTKTNTYKTYEIDYALTYPTGGKGFARVTMIMVSNMAYVFLGQSDGKTQSEDRNLFGKIIRSVNIDESRIPEPAKAKDYSEVIENVRMAVVPALQGMPSGWDWTLKSAEMNKGDKSGGMLLKLALNRSDTLLLTHGYAVIMNAIKTGDQSGFRTLKCDPTSLKEFSNQLGLITGVAASSSFGNTDLPVKYIAMEVCNARGQKNYKYTTDIDAFIKAVQANNVKKMSQAIECKLLKN